MTDETINDTNPHNDDQIDEELRVMIGCEYNSLQSAANCGITPYTGYNTESHMSKISYCTARHSQWLQSSGSLCYKSINYLNLCTAK